MINALSAPSPLSASLREQAEPGGPGGEHSAFALATHPCAAFVWTFSLSPIRP